MYTNQNEFSDLRKIDLLIRATRLYCHSMYQDYNPNYHPTIKRIVLNFAHRLFDTMSYEEDKINVILFSMFNNRTENSSERYSGIRIYIEFPDTSALEYELFKTNISKPEGNRYLIFSTHTPTKAK